MGVTIERLEFVIRLKSVDFPTFGRPTKTTAGAARARFCGMQRPEERLSMIKVDIVNEVSKVADITKVKAEVAVDAVFDAMRLSMQRGERIELRGFGVFQVKPRKRGIGRNPRTGKEVRIPPGRTIRFKPGKDLQNIGG
jgi:DNA-binding protein HU-beta